MAIEIRRATAGEMEQVGLMAAYVYGGAFGDGADNITATSMRPEWTLCAFDGAKLVTSFGAFPFTMRANGEAISFGGVTAVGTRPEYRRQGLVRRIMTQAIQDQKDQGQSVAGLWASQAAIYQRYGYAAAGANRHYSVDTADIRFYDVDPGSCSIERLSMPDCIEPAKALYREFIANRFGYLHRSSILWGENVFDGSSPDGPVYMALASDAEGAQGYVAYTLRANKVGHRARAQEIKIRDMGWLTLDAYRSMWSFLAGHDLVGRVLWENAPVDDPAPHLFSEPRMLHTDDREGSWMRLIDVPSALNNRGYLPVDTRCRVSLTIESDDLAPWNEGTWALELDGQGGREVTQAEHCNESLTLSVKTLASLYTGMHSALELSQAGLISGPLSSVRAANTAFATYFKPHCPDHY
ncbi:MAG: GNAT family N-acetyltransferase [Pseudomonadales bacterium]|nr:GNAT family N-acetyltransferase [Pseudomonadales bacterium]